MEYEIMSDERYASLKAVGAGDDTKIFVHFNPASLEYNASNQLQPQGEGDTKQFTTQSTAKLTMDLIFDTTDSGKDVRGITGQIVLLMKPQEVDDRGTVPPVVEFTWGAYRFKGLIESYKETINFFHPSGVPLRATVNLVLAAQDKVFDTGTGTGKSQPTEPAEVPGTPGRNATSLATQGGNPKAGKAIAKENGLETMRFTKGPLTVSTTIQTKGPSAFSSGSAGGVGIGGDIGGGIGGGISGGIGGGAGIGGGVGISGGAGIGISGGVSGGINVTGTSGTTTVNLLNATFGTQKSAGISVSQGAFNGLGASASASFTLKPQNLLPSAGAVAGISLTAGAGVNVGGQAAAGGSMKVELNANGKGARIIFE